MPGCGRRPGPLAPYWGAVEADTVRVLPPGPRSLLGPAEDKGQRCHGWSTAWGSGGQEGRGRRPEYNPHWPTSDQTGPVSTARPSPGARPASNRHLIRRPRPTGLLLSSGSGAL